MSAHTLTLVKSRGRPPLILFWLALLRLAIVIFPSDNFFTGVFFIVVNAFYIEKAIKSFLFFVCD